MSTNNNSNNQQQQQQQQQFQYLSKQLGIALGFDDGINDILEHLLTIESKPDLLDYLLQLLGSEKNDFVRSLVDDIDKYQRGETISSSAIIPDADNNNDSKKPNNTQTTISKSKETTTLSSTKLQQQQQSQQQQQPKKVITASMKPSSSTTTTTSSVSTSKLAPLRSKNKSNNSNNQIINNTNVSKVLQKREQKQHQQQKKQSAQAKAKDVATTNNNNNNATTGTDTISINDSNIATSTGTTTNREDNVLEKITYEPVTGVRTQPVCGCFATVHDELTNCMHCGRISCTVEGYDYCPFCSYMVYPVDIPLASISTGAGGTSDNEKEQILIEAWNRKERLLRYDRESAQQMVVIDDQNDYYKTESSMWATEDEKLQAIEAEEQRYNKIHSQQPITLNLNF